MKLFDGTEYNDSHYEIIQHWFTNADYEKAAKLAKTTIGNKSWEYKHFRVWLRPDMLALYFYSMPLSSIAEDFNYKFSYKTWVTALVKYYDEAYREFSKMGLTTDTIFKKQKA